MRELKRGFTLIELLIVAAIIGVIYSIAAATMKTGAIEQSAVWSLENLDVALRGLKGGYLKLICEGDRCENCRVVDENGEEIASVPALFEEIPRTFYFDESGYLDNLKFPSDRCFEMEKFENGAIGDTLTEHRGKFYRYYSFARAAETFASLDDAKDSFDPRVWIPQYGNEFFNEND
ncbi:MAG: type II secretion system GspH family protein [Helicobacteraceae bacterium]|jgi:prepilin-type N-terminal cleavage/methylation domain-containing protein|nr:type II secretion system GspH family protein [Helicobacteraceae bacterium]